MYKIVTVTLIVQDISWFRHGRVGTGPKDCSVQMKLPMNSEHFNTDVLQNSDKESRKDKFLINSSFLPKHFFLKFSTTY